MNLESVLLTRKKEIFELIKQFYSLEYARQFECFTLTDTTPIIQASNQVLTQTPKKFGLCTVMSSYLSSLLTDEYNLPAVVVAGDLIINGIPAFQTDQRIQTHNHSSDIIIDNWKGHCWVEVGEMICDISIGRTADLAPAISNLKRFIHQNFGEGKGLLAFDVKSAYAAGMIYTPREVLADAVITSIFQSYYHANS